MSEPGPERPTLMPVEVLALTQRRIQSATAGGVGAHAAATCSGLTFAGAAVRAIAAPRG